jgi:hypothetical protein
MCFIPNRCHLMPVVLRFGCNHFAFVLTIYPIAVVHFLPLFIYFLPFMFFFFLSVSPASLPLFHCSLFFVSFSFLHFLCFPSFPSTFSTSS